MSKWETKKMWNPWKQKFPRVRRIQRAERNKNMKIQDVLSTGFGVLLVLKVEVLVDNIEFNCWKKKREKERLRS